MSFDHDMNGTPVKFSPPVPELDDHRHQIASVPRTDRPRRGTFDSLYGTHKLDQPVLHAAPGTPRGRDHGGPLSPRIRDFVQKDEAAVDDDSNELSPTARRPRDESPPNSVKAFAEARRRERDATLSEPVAERPGTRDNSSSKIDNTTHYDNNVAIHSSSDESLGTPSVVDCLSLGSNAHKIAKDDVLSMLSRKSVTAEDVCFPVADEHRQGSVNIDFDYLESFIRADSDLRAATRRSYITKSFTDLRVTPPMMPTVRLPTCDGDIVEMPSDSSTATHEKGEAHDDVALDEKSLYQAPDPDRVSFFSSAWESTIHAADLGGLILPGEDVRGLFSFPKDETDGVWWLNINKPTEAEVRAICRAFSVHPLTVEDITTREAREKIELFPSYYFASFRSFNVEDDDEAPGEQIYVPFNTYVIVFREGTLSFSFARNSHASHVRQRITMLKDYVALSSDWICYALIDDIVDGFAPALSKIERDTDQIEDEMFIARPNDMHHFLRKLGHVRKNVMGLMRLLGGKADVLKGFTKRCNENYKVMPRMDIGLYLGDIQDHVVTMMNNLGHFEKMLSRSHSNYLAQLSIDSIMQGTDTNKFLSNITFLASIIMPLNVVTGLFGMNVEVPFEHDEAGIVPFMVIMSGLILFVICSVFLARRLRYI